MTQQFVVVELPSPISTNELFIAIGKRRVKSARYSKWLRDAAVLMLEQKPRSVEGPYALTIRVPVKWRGDLDNAAKAVSDFLQSQGVITNDRLAQRIVIEKWPQTFMQAMVVSTKEAAS